MLIRAKELGREGAFFMESFFKMSQLEENEVFNIKKNSVNKNLICHPLEQIK